MASYSTNEFKGGLKIMMDGDPCSIIENEFVKPGKGQAFNRVKIRNLITGRVLEKTFKSGESVEGADVHETEMQYLYSDGERWLVLDCMTKTSPPEDRWLSIAISKEDRQRGDDEQLIKEAVESSEETGVELPEGAATEGSSSS